MIVAALVMAASMTDGAPCTPVGSWWRDMDGENHLQAEMRLEAFMPWRDVTMPTGACYAILANPGQGKLRITKVRTFWATDRGHIAEADLKVVVNGRQIVTRSEHKEGPGIYDAWKGETVNDVIVSPTIIEFHTQGWPTTEAPATMHFGVILDMTWTPPPPPVKPRR